MIVRSLVDRHAEERQALASVQADAGGTLTDAAGGSLHQLAISPTVWGPASSPNSAACLYPRPVNDAEWLAELVIDLEEDQPAAPGRALRQVVKSSG